MSYYSAHRKIEVAAKALIESAVAAATVHGTDDLGVVWAARQIFAICPDSSGNDRLRGNEDIELRIEVQTRLLLYSSRSTAVADHHSLFDSIVGVIMINELAEQLNALMTDATVVGIHAGDKISHSNSNSVLTSALTRTLSAIPQ